MSNPITARVALEIASHEALVRQTYLDSVGVPTWCVGMTDATGHKVSRYWNNPQSLQKCMDLYVWALDNYANAVRNRFADCTLSEAQFTGILSWTWNVGEGWLDRASWINRFKIGDFKEAERRFLLFNKPPEIRGRRRKEADLIFRDKWTNDGTMIEYTRVTSRRTPDWRSAKRINVDTEMGRAIRDHRATSKNFIPTIPEYTQLPTLTPEAAPQPKPATESTTIWAALAQYAAGTISALATLDWKIALPLVLIGGFLAFWIIKERLKKSQEYGA